MVDSEWQFAPILVATNKERNNIIRHQSRLFGQHHGTYVFKWRVFEKKWKNKPHPQLLKKITDAEAFFWQYFVPGADAFITFNINPELGLANGSPVRCHSLGFKKTAMIQAIKALIQGNGTHNPLPFGSEIELHTPPDALFVEILPSLDDKEPTTKRKLQMSMLQTQSIDNPENKIVIPIEPVKESDKDRSQWKVIAFKTHSSFSPIAEAEFRVPFPLEMAFAMTVHKAQGRTLSRVILALTQQPNTASQMKYAAIFVALSRVKHASHIRLLDHNYTSMSLQQGRLRAYAYLTNLKPDEHVTLFYLGYTDQNGAWDPDKMPKKSTQNSLTS
jgi:hypothetical protein